MLGFLAPLGGLLMSIAGSLAGRVLLALGMSFVTYQGMSVGIDWLLVQIKNDINSMPVDIVNFLAWLWLDKAISVVFSAYTVATMIQMAGASSITKLVTK